MDIMANGRRSWRLIGVLAIMLVWGMAQGFQQAYGESFTELPSESTKKELKDKAIKAIKASHQILEFHYLNEPAPSKKRNLTALALAALAYEVATAATEIGVLSDLVEALEFQYALSCSQSGYSFNQLCQNLLSLSHINDMAIGDLSRINDMAINDLIKKITDLYAQVAKKFHNDLSKGLRIIETDIVVIIYFPDGNNMVLPTSYMRMADGYILWKKYEAFRYYFTKNPANCGSESSLCEFIFTGKNKLSDMRSIAEELSSIFKDKPINSDKLYQFFNEGTNPDSGIVMYHKNLLICDAQIDDEGNHRLLMQCSDSKTRQKWNKKAVAKDNSNNLSGMGAGMRWCDDKPEGHFNQIKNELTDKKEFSTKNPRFGCEERKQTEGADDKYSQEQKSSELTEFDALEGQLNEGLREVLTSKSDDCEPHKKSPRPSQEKPVLNKPPKAPSCYKVPQKVGDGVSVDCDIKLFEHNSSGETKCLVRAEREIDIDNPKQDTDKGYCSGTGCYMQ